jgi:hypothetical protein
LKNERDPGCDFPGGWQNGLGFLGKNLPEQSAVP